ncbi:hypothetical protein NN561_014764 [Cricetulus griseus]
MQGSVPPSRGPPARGRGRDPGCALPVLCKGARLLVLPYPEARSPSLGRVRCPSLVWSGGRVGFVSPLPSVAHPKKGAAALTGNKRAFLSGLKGSNVAENAEPEAEVTSRPTPLLFSGLWDLLGGCPRALRSARLSAIGITRRRCIFHSRTGRRCLLPAAQLWPKGLLGLYRTEYFLCPSLLSSCLPQE